MSLKRIRLGAICSIEKGETPILKANPGEYPLVVTSEERKSHSSYQFDSDAVVIPLVSSTGHGHKSLKRIHFQSGKFALGSILCAVIPKESSGLDVRYLYRYLDLHKEKELVGRMRGMANVTLPIKEIAQIEIPLPPLSVQLAFVSAFEKAEIQKSDLQHTFQRQLNLLKQTRQAFLREAMQGRLVPQDPQEESAELLLKRIKAEKARLIREGKLKKEKPLPPIKAEELPFDLPEGWVWCRLGEITNSISTGPFGSMLHKSDYVSNGIPVVNPQNMVKGCVVRLDKMQVSENTRRKLSSYELKSGDIVMARRGEMGRAAVISDNEAGWLCGTGSFFLRLASFLNRDFLIIYFSSSDAKSFLMGASVGSTMNNLNHRILSSMPIPLPPLAEQARIVAKLEEVLGLCDALATQVQESQTQVERLLAQVLREALEG